MTPSLIMTPDISAETWLGAAGCAAGSQTWSGITPALLAKPSARSDEDQRSARARPGPAAAAGQSAKRRLPVQAAMRSMPASRQASPACVITA